MLKQQGNDYLLIVLEPGKNADRADIWYELKDDGSPQNLADSILSLLSNLYDKEDLIGLLSGYCDVLIERDDEEEEDDTPSPPKLKKKKKSPPDDDGEESIA